MVFAENTPCLSEKKEYLRFILVDVATILSTYQPILKDIWILKQKMCLEEY